MQTLRPEVASKVLDSIKVKARLCYELNKHMVTIETMVKDKALLLTTPTAVRAIAEELAIGEDTVLTELEPQMK